MFGRNKRNQQRVLEQCAPVPQPPTMLSAEDRAFLEVLAGEIQGCLITVGGEPILDDAEGVDVATLCPTPCIEIQYADKLVTLPLEVYHYTDEDL